MLPCKAQQRSSILEGQAIEGTLRCPCNTRNYQDQATLSLTSSNQCIHAPVCFDLGWPSSYSY